MVYIKISFLGAWVGRDGFSRIFQKQLFNHRSSFKAMEMRADIERGGKKRKKERKGKQKKKKKKKTNPTTTTTTRSTDTNAFVKKKKKKIAWRQLFGLTANA
jgi:hypothetical protein